MKRMNRIDYFDLDGAAPRLFLALFEEGSATGAAIRLGRRHGRLAELPMHMAWHRRFQDDPAHVWLRRLLDETAAEVARSHAPER